MPRIAKLLVKGDNPRAEVALLDQVFDEAGSEFDNLSRAPRL